MAITSVGEAGVNGFVVGTTGLAITPNASTLTDDLIVNFVHRDYDSGSFDTISGWTLIASEVNGTKQQCAAYYQIATTDAPGATTFTHTSAGSQETSISSHSFRGVDTTTPVDVTYASGSHYKATSYKDGGANADASPAITTATDGALIMLCEGITHDDIYDVGSPPTGYTASTALTGASNSDAQLMNYYKIAGTAGTDTPDAATYLSTVSSPADSQMFTFAFRESGAGGTSIPIFMNHYRQMQK